MKKKILFFPSAWSGDDIFLPQAHYLKENFDVLKNNKNCRAYVNVEGAAKVNHVLMEWLMS